MSRSLQLAAYLPAKPAILFDMYLNARSHAAFTGAPVEIRPRAGAHFEAFNGQLSGTILQVVPKRLIVQAWRSTGWAKTAIDSTLVLLFESEKKGTRLELTHVNVPETDFAGVSDGWNKYYWQPWRTYLESKAQGRLDKRA